MNPQPKIEAGHVTDEARDPRERYSLFRLCDCTTCEGKGKVPISAYVSDPALRKVGLKCPDCRGEGRVRQELAACDSPEAVGVALVTLAREGEWLDEDGNPCAFGLLDREGEKNHKWLVSPWLASARNVTDAARTLAQSKTRTSAQ